MLSHSSIIVCLCMVFFLSYLFEPKGVCLKKCSPFSHLPRSEEEIFASSTRRTVDSLVFTKDRPLLLLRLLEAYRMHCRNAGDMAVVASASTPLLRAAYSRVNEHFPSVRFFYEGEAGVGDFKQATLRALHELSSPYVMPLVDEVVFTRNVDLVHVAASLDRHAPNGTFQLHLGLAYAGSASVPRQTVLETAVSSMHDSVRGFPWSPDLETQQLSFYHVINLEASVYSLARVRRDWATPAFRHPGELEFAWYHAKFDFLPSDLHLFYSRAVCVNIESGQHIREDAPERTELGVLEADARSVMQGSRFNIAALIGMNITTSHMSIPLTLLVGDIGRW